MSSNDKFLGTTESSSSSLSNGSLTVFAQSLGALNLDPSQPVKTNSVRQLISSKLDISDINNLRQELNNIIRNPYVGTIKATDFETENYFSINDELQKIDNFKPSTEVPRTTTIEGDLILEGGNPSTLTTEVVKNSGNAIITLNPDDSIDLVATDVRINGLPIIQEDLEPRVELLESKTESISRIGTDTKIGNNFVVTDEDEIFVNNTILEIVGNSGSLTIDSGARGSIISAPIQPEHITNKSYVDNFNRFDQELNKNNNVEFNTIQTNQIDGGSGGTLAPLKLKGTETIIEGETEIELDTVSAIYNGAITANNNLVNKGYVDNQISTLEPRVSAVEDKTSLQTRNGNTLTFTGNQFNLDGAGIRVGNEVDTRLLYLQDTTQTSGPPDATSSFIFNDESNSGKLTYFRKPNPTTNDKQLILTTKGGESVSTTLSTSQTSFINDQELITKKYVDDEIAGIPVGNPFDQDLNTSDGVSFTNVGVGVIPPNPTDKLALINSKSIAIGLDGVDPLGKFSIVNDLGGVNPDGITIDWKQDLSLQNFMTMNKGENVILDTGVTIENVKDPVNDLDISNKQYVDNKMSGMRMVGGTFDTGTNVTLYDDPDTTIIWNGITKYPQWLSKTTGGYVATTVSLINGILPSPYLNTKSASEDTFINTAGVLFSFNGIPDGTPNTDFAHLQFKSKGTYTLLKESFANPSKYVIMDLVTGQLNLPGVFSIQIID